MESLHAVKQQRHALDAAFVWLSADSPNGLLTTLINHLAHIAWLREQWLADSDPHYWQARVEEMSDELADLVDQLGGAS